MTLGLLSVITSSYIITPSYSQFNITAPQDQEAVVKANLVRFDKLDFDAFSNQNWTLFNEIHAPDVKVVWPDGRQTTGIEQHDKDVKAFFAYAPDTKIKVHPIKFGALSKIKNKETRGSKPVNYTLDTQKITFVLWGRFGQANRVVIVDRYSLSNLI
ncbi:MAG: hypothetical protein WBY28_07025 [Nitrososphaeraceae archaeon]